MPHILRGWRWRLLASALLLGLAALVLWPVLPYGARQIVFNSDRDGDHDIYLLDVDSGRTRNLTWNDREDWHPAWSPDGRTIAWVSGDYNAAWGVYLMDDRGENVRLLEGDCTSQTCGPSQPRWSPDGRFVAYNWARGPDWGEIHLADVATGAVANLSDRPGWTGPDGQPVWSPDGRRIVFNARPDNQDGLYVLDLPAAGEPIGAARLIAPLRASGLQWSPDGSLVAFLGNELYTSGTRVGLLDLDAGEYEFITPDDAGDAWPEGWWPGGDLVHVLRRSADGHTYWHELVNREGKVVAPLLPDYQEFRELVWWGGDALAAFSLQVAGPDGRYPNASDLYVADLDGLAAGTLRPLTHDAGFNFEPAWRP